MAVTLIVEDGTGVANANSYADVAYARSFAESVGLPLPADDNAVAVALLGAMPYIESQPYQGQPAQPGQALQWPRMLVIVNGDMLPDDSIPEGVKKAQAQAASMVISGTELFPTIEGQRVTEETVGPITTKYSDQYTNTWNGQNVFSAINVYLQPYIIWVGGYRLSPAFGF